MTVTSSVPPARVPGAVITSKHLPGLGSTSTFPPADDDGFVSVSHLLAALPHFAMPHFQRGRVWDEAATSRLMESLIDDTPCGSIILWQPVGDVEAFGELPPEWRDSSHPVANYLVVDGQQRLTSLRDVFGPDRAWAVNLAAFPQLNLDPPRLMESRDCFVPIPEPLRPDVGKTARKNYAIKTRRLIPLDDVARLGARAWSAGPAAAQQWEALAEAIRRAVNRRLHVVVKRTQSLAQIVNLYNRINSSGVPVKKEERAFAAMVSFEPGTTQWLANCFKAAHPDADTSDRNVLLKRQRERLFGFPLFIAAYAQTVGYHQNLRGDLDLLAREDANVSWVSKNPETARSMLDDSYRCIATTAGVLRDRLGCDDLRFLPSADPLRLAFALLLRYPQVDDVALAAVLLLGQVNRITQTVKARQIEEKVSDSSHLIQALNAFPSVVDMVGNVDHFTDRLLDVQTMNDPWVSLLYWYQRRRRAQDYVPTAEPPWAPQWTQLDVHAAAQREHIVPFSLLYRAHGVNPRGHNAQSPINAIGNLTMISAMLNYDHGSEPIDLDLLERDLLTAHHLDTDDVLDAYRATLAAIRAHPDLGHSNIASTYEVFLHRRTRSLAAGMHAWLVSTCAANTPNQSPVARRIYPSSVDQVLQQPWRMSFKQALLDLHTKHQGKHWLLYRTSGKNTVAHKIRLRQDGCLLTVGKQILNAEALREELAALLETSFDDSTQCGFQLDPGSDEGAQALRIICTRTTR